MLRCLLLFIVCLPLAYAEVGEIVSLNSSDAYLTRGGAKTLLATGTALEVGDEIFTESAHVVLILYPKIQMSIVKGSHIVISQHLVDEANGEEQTTSLIQLIQGLIRMQVTREGNEKVDQKVDARNVTFAVRGTEFEVSSTDEDAELDVFEGQVEVSSPYVQSFVPEIVKPNEGFRFDRKARKFARRAHRERIRDARFLRKQELHDHWLKKKANRKSRKEMRKQVREERRNRKGRGR